MSNRVIGKLKKRHDTNEIHAQTRHGAQLNVEIVSGHSRTDNVITYNISNRITNTNIGKGHSSQI